MSVPARQCVTCSDAAALATVIEVGEYDALVEVEGCRQLVAIEFVLPVAVGERLLCHAGVALARSDGP